MTAGENINNNNTLGGMGSLGNGNSNGVVVSSGLSGKGRKKLSKEERAARSAEREVRKAERQAKKAERLATKLAPLNVVDQPLITKESECPIIKEQDKEPLQLATNDAALTTESEKRELSNDVLHSEKKKLTKEERDLRTAERIARKAARKAKKEDSHPVTTEARLIPALSTPIKEEKQSPSGNELSGEKKLTKEERQARKQARKAAKEARSHEQPVATEVKDEKRISSSSSDELSGEKKKKEKLTKEQRELKAAERQARKAARKAEKEAKQLVSSEPSLTSIIPQTKEEKRQQREKNRAERAQRKEERHKAREEKLQLKAEKQRIFDSVVLEQFPAGDISHLFLDGNNMMFVANCLRSMTLNRKQRKVERLFDRFTIQFLEATSQKISKTTLVFDNTPVKRDQRVKDTDFELCSARPRFETSDDAIVQWLSDIKTTPGTKLCVTSDRGLIERIAKEGGLVMKPKKWMLYAAALISKREVDSFDNWMSEWCDSQTDI